RSPLDDVRRRRTATTITTNSPAIPGGDPMRGDNFSEGRHRHRPSLGFSAPSSGLLAHDAEAEAQKEREREEERRRTTRPTRRPEPWEWYYYGEAPVSANEDRSQ